MPCALTASPEPREAVTLTWLDFHGGFLLTYLLTGLDSHRSLLLIYGFAHWPHYALCSDSKSWTTRGCHRPWSSRFEIFTCQSGSTCCDVCGTLCFTGTWTIPTGWVRKKWNTCQPQERAFLYSMKIRVIIECNVKRANQMTLLTAETFAFEGAALSSCWHIRWWLCLYLFVILCWCLCVLYLMFIVGWMMSSFVCQFYPVLANSVWWWLVFNLWQSVKKKR